MKNNKYFKRVKRISALLLTVALLLGGVFVFSSCSSRAPEIEDVYDRVVYLIENAAEVNTVLFGEGLPVFSSGSEESELLNLYYMSSKDGREYVKPYAMYENIDEIKEKAELVYGGEYLKSLYESTFTGYAISEVEDVVLPARYSEDANWIYQNSTVTGLITGHRSYNYATMRIVSPSSAKYMRIEIESYSDDATDSPITDTLSFVYENGNWYLDGPSC